MRTDEMLQALRNARGDYDKALGDLPWDRHIASDDQRQITAVETLLDLLGDLITEAEEAETWDCIRRCQGKGDA